MLKHIFDKTCMSRIYEEICPNTCNYKEHKHK